jgi:hypothetical protein
MSYESAMYGEGQASTNYARHEFRTIYLYTEYGRHLAQSLFGLNNDMLEAFVGRYSRGKHVGALRGFIQAKIIVHGGWIRGRGVTPRGIESARLQNGWSYDIETFAEYDRHKSI